MKEHIHKKSKIRVNRTLNIVTQNRAVQCWNPFQSLFSYSDTEIENKYKKIKSSLTRSQNKVMKDIIRMTGYKGFRGGHYYVEKGGLYSRWSGLPDAKKRNNFPYSLPSSHYPEKKKEQYEIQLPNNWFGDNWGTVLFGIRKGNKNHRATWFQVEGHSGVWGDSTIRYVSDLLLHSVDYLKHVYTGQNIGPFGTDVRSEKNHTEEIVKR